jgi:hypothetical protein
MDKPQRSFLAILEKSRSLTEACESFGIDRKQFFEWMSDLQFARAISRSAIGSQLAVEDALFVKSLQGDVSAIRLFFNRLAEIELEQPKSYIDRQMDILRGLKD